MCSNRKATAGIGNRRCTKDYLAPRYAVDATNGWSIPTDHKRHNKNRMCLASGKNIQRLSWKLNAKSMMKSIIFTQRELV